MPEKSEPVLSALIGGSVARHILTVLGSIAVSKGWIDGGQVETVIGAVMVVGGLIWSIVQKVRST